MSHRCAQTWAATGSTASQRICCRGGRRQPVQAAARHRPVRRVAHPNVELSARNFVAGAQPALGGPVQALATLRPEFLDPLATDPDLPKLALRTHQVRPLDTEALRSVIEGPAKIAGLRFEPDLVTGW